MRSFDDYVATVRKGWEPATHDLEAAAEAYFEVQVQAQLDLGAQIARARQSEHLTQADLAARSSVTQPEISRIERGVGNPTRETLMRIAAALHRRIVLVFDKKDSREDTLV